MSRDDVSLAILAQAVGIEREGIAFYDQAASKSSSARVQQVFRSLVNDEVGHEKILQAEIDSLKAKGQWLPAPDALSAIPTGLSLFSRHRDAADRAGAAPSDLEALSFAMNMEQKGYDLYTGAAAQTTDADGQALFRRLAKMESHHYKVLQDAYGYLTHPDHWYDDEEKPMFEGG